MPDITALQGSARAFMGHALEVVSNPGKTPPPRYEEHLLATPPGKQDGSGRLQMEAPPDDTDSATATLLQLMQVMAENQLIFKKIFREMRDASSAQQQQFLQESADSTRSAGQKQLIGNVISGSLQIAGGAASIGMATRSAPGIPSGAPTTGSAGKAAADAAAASANSFVQKNVAYANSMSASLKGVGDIAKGSSDYAATLDHATKQEQDAKAEAASRSREQSQEAASQAQANFDKTLSILGEILANDHAIKKSVIA